MSIENFVHLLSSMYTTQDNETRQMYTLELLKAEDRLNQEELRDIGVGLLSNSAYGLAIQAYGAVLLRRAIESGRIRASSLPYNELITWYLEERTLSRLVCSDIVDLITECMVHEWPERCSNLMEQICPSFAQLAHHPRKVSLLSSLVTRCTEPHAFKVPVDRMKKLMDAIKVHSRAILIEVIQALFDIYTAAGGADNCAPSPGTEETISGCLLIIGSVAPLIPLKHWEALGISSTLKALLKWRAVARDTMSSLIVILRCDRLSRPQSPPEEAMQSTVTSVTHTIWLELLNAALCSTEWWLAERNYSILEEITELVLEAPGTVINSVTPLLSQVCLHILSLPSIYLASSACSILRRLGDAVFTHINPADLMTRMALLVPKNKFHLKLGTDREGMLLSEQQYGSIDAFEQGFAEFRSLAGQLLSAAARIYPVVSNQFVLQLIAALCDADGTAEDPRTNLGFVTQQSPTFIAWEATQFLVTSLSESFRHSSEYLPYVINELASKQPSDMVIYPVYLNLVSLLWNCRDATALGVWEGTVNIIINSLMCRPKNFGDIDVMSARKRAITLLVTACTNHAEKLKNLSAGFIQQLERVLMLPFTVPQERILLYEAMAAFTKVLPVDEAEQRLQTFLQPIASILAERVRGMDQQIFNDMIIASTKSHYELRDLVCDSLNIMAGVLRHCNTSCVTEILTGVMPFIVQLVDFAHSMHVGGLPFPYCNIDEMSSAERQQLLPNGSRRNMGSNQKKCPLQRARGALMSLRTALYQLVGSLSVFFPRENVRNMLDILATVIHTLSVNVVRHLVSQCLLPIAKANEALVEVVLPACTAFYKHRAQHRTQRPEDEVIENKQIFHLSKEIFTFIRLEVLNLKRLDGNVRFTQSVLDLLLSTLRCGVNVGEATRLITTTLTSCMDDATLNATDRSIMLETAVHAYGCMLDFVVGADDDKLPPRQREQLASSLADMYLTSYPLYAPSIRARYQQERVEELNAHLAISARMDTKRRRFREFILQKTGDTVDTRLSACS
ncbi:hypothetical protein TRVL_01279 [Trypanosoma vivax]|nr:hypothetical protein TRVL_01279 [Trypanosoma vivax]